MTPEEELLRQENSRLQEQDHSQQELIERQSQQIAVRTAQVENLQARLSKDSYNSHLPPFSPISTCFWSYRGNIQQEVILTGGFDGNN